MKLEVRESKVDGVVVLEPVGRLETKTSPELEKKIVALLASGERQIVLDLKETEYVSSAGLRVFLMLAKKLAGGAGRLSLCGLNSSVREVFEIAGFASLFSIHATRAEALSAPAPSGGVRAGRPAPAKTIPPRARPAPGRSQAPADPPPPALPTLLDRVGAAFGIRDEAAPPTSADPALVDRAARALGTRRGGA